MFKLFRKLTASSKKRRCGDSWVKAHFNDFGEWIVDTLTESNKESNFKMHSAVPIADDGRPPTLTYINIDAATVWLSICVAYLTFIFAKLFGLMCLSVNLGAALMGNSLSLL